ncbi:hypothetical protein [Thalassomonas sp. RHCl1]|uniref:hypothetical protein n=1 Tax=Thalassomonas sp. RHCl1 TaxID=2995320 RepID=UPI00248CDA10|nr:hypothetical protein [Thalassomonas sp. RHCl1]
MPIQEVEIQSLKVAKISAIVSGVVAASSLFVSFYSIHTQKQIHSENLEKEIIRAVMLADTKEKCDMLKAIGHSMWVKDKEEDPVDSEWWMRVSSGMGECGVSLNKPVQPTAKNAAAG